MNDLAPLAGVQLWALDGVPMVGPGDNLADVVAAGLTASGLTPEDGDVLVVAQKIVSKSEGRFVDLRTVSPGPRSLELAALTEKDPRLIEVILSESVAVVKHRIGVLIVEHRLGIVMANAGVDASNVSTDAGAEPVLLLPEDPDESCRSLRRDLQRRHGANVAVIINDSVGRAWRNGTVGLAIGVSGLPALWDLRGNPDLYGRKLEISQTGLADELASAASLLQGQGDEGRPLVLIRGLRLPDAGPDAGVSTLLRPAEEDLFR